MERNVVSSKSKKAKFTGIPIKVSSYENLTNVTSSSNSIRRRKTDFAVQSMTWTTTSAKDFVTSYLRLKVKHQRVKHLRTNSILALGDTMLSASVTVSGKSSRSVFSEEVQRRSSKDLLDIFYWVIRMIRFAVRLNINLKRHIHSNNKTQAQTAAELHYYALETGFRCEKLVFCKSDFAATNRVYIPKWALEIMWQQPELRSEADVKRLVLLFKLFKGFKDKFSSDAQEEFCRHCQYTWYEKRRTLLRAGHPGMMFYLLFSGSVFVNIEEKATKTGKVYTRTECVLPRGSMFGEISLLHNIPRSATIICRENVEAITVSKEVFLRLSTDKMQREVMLKVKYLKECGVFSDWPDNCLRELCMHSITNEYNYGKIIEHNTKTSEFLYIVIQGHVEVMCKVTTDATIELSSDDETGNYLPKLPSPDPVILCPNWENERPPLALVRVDSVVPFHPVDLRCILKDCEHNGMVIASLGAEVMRIPKLRLQTIPPPLYWRALHQKAQDILKYPCVSAMKKAFLERNQWTIFRSVIQDDVLDRRDGALIATKAATKKGTTGWSKFPGMQRKKLPPIKPPFLTCLLSDTPPHQHTAREHSGYCLKIINVNKHMQNRISREVSLILRKK